MVLGLMVAVAAGGRGIGNGRRSEGQQAAGEVGCQNASEVEKIA
jgi:hypothetical protein